MTKTNTKAYMNGETHTKQLNCLKVIVDNSEE